MNNILEAIEKEAGKCIKCGFCEAVCPTLFAKGYSSYYGARGRMVLAGELIRKNNNEFMNFLKASQNAFDTCLDCYACLVECPAGINVGIVSDLVKKLIVTQPSEKIRPNSISAFITTPILKYNNPLGLKKECYEWSELLNLSNKGEYLLFTGCLYQLMPYSSKLINLTSKVGENSTKRLASWCKYMPSLIKFSKFLYYPDTKERVKKIIKSIVELLKLSKIDFYYDKDLEFYPGTYLHDLGFENLFIQYAEKVTRKFKRKNVKKIITIDPHTYDLLKNIYPMYTDFQFEVFYYLDLLNIKFKKTNIKTTFHDPCHLSRHSKYFITPRNLINRVATNIEPVHSKERTMCCGGPDELMFPAIAKKVSSRRYDELKKTDAQIILTSCPVCLMNLNKGDDVLDISEFLLAHLE